MHYLATRLQAAQRIVLDRPEVPEAIPDGHVRLRLEVASLCGTDLHYYRHFANAGFELQNPVTLGHEACARVIDANGTDLSQGQLVALNPIMNCDACDPCNRGEINLCTSKKFPGSATVRPHLDGFFREIFDHPATLCRVVPDHVDPRHLAFAEPFACALHAANKGRVNSGDHVLVTGCGPMGLLAVAGAVSKGALVTCMDVRRDAAELGRKAGAYGVHTPESFDTAALDGTFDVVIEASGAIPAFNLALRALRRKGRLSILSNIQPSRAIVDLHLIMLKEIEIVGSLQFSREFEEAVRVIEADNIDFDALIAATFSLAEAARAFELMDSGQAAGKILLALEP